MVRKALRLLIGMSVLANVALTSSPFAWKTTQRVLYTKTAFGDEITRSVLYVPDAPEHTLFQSFRVDAGKTNTPAFTIDEEQVWVQGEMRGRSGTFAGYAVYLMKGGDRVFIKWAADAKPTGVRDDGEPATESGTITVLGGTGHFSKIRGGGIYRGYRKGPILEENILDILF